jgi:hypothetical protein
LTPAVRNPGMKIVRRIVIPSGKTQAFRQGRAKLGFFPRTGGAPVGAAAKIREQESHRKQAPGEALVA